MTMSANSCSWQHLICSRVFCREAVKIEPNNKDARNKLKECENTIKKLRIENTINADAVRVIALKCRTRSKRLDWCPTILHIALVHIEECMLNRICMYLPLTLLPWQISTTIDPDSIEVEATYDGPRLGIDGQVIDLC